MRGILKPAAALLALIAEPLAAHSPTCEQIEVMEAASRFFDALRSEDRTLLAERMISNGTVFVHDRMASSDSKMRIFTVADFLTAHANRTASINEKMVYETVLVDGDMAQIWGPYTFAVDGTLTHCGINSLSMVRSDDVWSVANTSFTMESPENCGEIRAKVDAIWETVE